MVKRDKCKYLEIKSSRNFDGMFAIYKKGKLYDEPHASKRLANNQIKRIFGCRIKLK